MSQNQDRQSQNQDVPLDSKAGHGGPRNGAGRKAKGEAPMTVAERKRRSRAAVLSVMLAATPASAEVIMGHVRVIDGDTLDIEGRRVRLAGIDAPERSQSCDRAGEPWSCGHDATAALAEHIGQAQVTCTSDRDDRYGRALASCTMGREDIGQWLVISGLAVAYRKYSMAYVHDEDEAKAARRGIWAGAFQTPEQYRRGREAQWHR
jgi:endonuclease YncB( thermonuclease family)